MKVVIVMAAASSDGDMSMVEKKSMVVSCMLEER